MGAYSFLPPLLVLALGKGAIEVGIVSSIHLFGLFLGPLIWSKFAPVTNRKYLVILGYLGMLFGLLMLSNTNFIYPAVFIMAFFPQASYFAVIAEVPEELAIEEYIQNYYDLQRVRGEWFNLDRKDVTNILKYLLSFKVVVPKLSRKDRERIGSITKLPERK